MRKKLLYFLFIFLLLSAGLFISYRIYGHSLKAFKKQSLLNKKKKNWQALEKRIQNRIDRFNGRVGLVVKDLDTGWEICINENELFPSASLVKIPVMLSYFYAEEEEKINLREKVKVRSSQMVSGSKLIGNYRPGANFVIEDLFDPMITLSDNSATNILIDRLGLAALNAYFKKMGLRDTNISRSMMDFKSRSAGRENYTSASDMASILEKLYRNQFLTAQISQKCLLLLSRQKVNDRIPKKLPKDEILAAHKTGLERHICHDVGIVYTPKGNFLICVLVRHKDKLALKSKRLISDIALSTYNYYRDL